MKKLNIKKGSTKSKKHFDLTTGNENAVTLQACTARLSAGDAMLTVLDVMSESDMGATFGTRDIRKISKMLQEEYGYMDKFIEWHKNWKEAQPYTRGEILKHKESGKYCAVWSISKTTPNIYIMNSKSGIYTVQTKQDVKKKYERTGRHIGNAIDWLMGAIEGKVIVREDKQRNSLMSHESQMIDLKVVKEQ